MKRYLLGIIFFVGLIGGNSQLSFAQVNLDISNPTTVPAANICPSATNVLIYSFTLTASGTGFDHFTALAFGQTGTASVTDGDIVQYHLWVNAVGGVGTLLSTSTTTSFSSFSAVQFFSATGTSKIYFITADISAIATVGDNITVSALTLGDGTGDGTGSVTTGSTSTTITNTAGAVAGGTQTVQATPTITSTTPGSTCGTGTVTLGATASAGTVNWYTVSTGGASIFTGSPYTTPSISSTTTYYVDATSGACTTPSRSAVTASVGTAPTIVTTTPGSTCGGTGTVTLGATASAGTVNWYTASTGGASISTGTSFTTPVISTTTTYYVDATSGACTTPSRSAITASVGTTPSIVTTTPGSTCGSGPVTLGATASAGVVNWYTASTGGTSISTGTSFTTPVISSPTTYWVAATSGGCTTASRSPVIATVNTVPTITGTTPASRCGTGTVALGATASAGTVNWYTASTGGSSIFNGGTYTTTAISSTTTYWVDATSGGCTTTTRSSVMATINSIPVITGTTPAARCAAGTLNLEATASAGTVNWYTASTGGSSIFSGGTYTTPAISATTTYWVDATSSGCITATRSPVAASVNSLPTITATATPSPLCAGQTLNLNSSPAGGSGTYVTFVWNGPSGFSAGTQNTSITNVATSGAGVYNVTVTDNNGCISASPGATASVVVNALPTITATAMPNPICAGQTLSLHSTASGGGGTYVSYAWNGPAGFTALSQNTSILSIAVGQAGVYNVTVTDNKGCTSHVGLTTSVVVSPLPVITAAATPNPICATATLTLNATPTGGTPPYATFSWAGPGGFTAAVQNTAIANISASGAGIYSVTVTDNKGCTSANPGTTTAVVVNPLPSPITGAANVCVGSTTTLNSNPTTGTWNSSNTTDANIVSGTGVVSGISAGDVTITYTLSTGCIAIVPFTVNPLPSPISGNTAVCSGQTATLSDATLPGTWHSANTNIATVIAGTGVVTGVGSGGTAVVTYTLVTGCTMTANVTVNPLPQTPVITTTPPSEICLNTMYQSFGANAPPLGSSESYEWTATNGMWAEDTPNNQNCLVNFTTEGPNTIQLTATIKATGCQSHASATVTVTVNTNSTIQTDSVINFESSLICLQTGVKYLWGYDVAATLVDDTLPSVSPYNNTSQNYYFGYSPNFTDTLFWVKTTDPATGCFEKSYYYAPAKNKGFNTNTGNGGLGEMKVYPNPAMNFLNVLFDNIENNVTLKISDIMGREIMMLPVQNVLTGIDVSALQPSVYFLECYQDGVKVADSKFVKN